MISPFFDLFMIQETFVTMMIGHELRRALRFPELLQKRAITAISLHQRSTEALAAGNPAVWAG